MEMWGSCAAHAVADELCGRRGRVRNRIEWVALSIERDARRQRAEQDLVLLAAEGVARIPEALAIAMATAATPVTE